MQTVLAVMVFSILVAGCGEAKKGAVNAPVVAADAWLACGQFAAAPADGSEIALTYDAAGEIIPGGFVERDTLFLRGTEPGPNDKGFYTIKPASGEVYLRAEDVADTCPTDGTAVITGYRATDKNIKLTATPNNDNRICNIQGEKPIVIKSFKIDAATTPGYMFVQTEAIDDCGSEEREGFLPIAGGVFGKFYFGKPTAGMDLVKGIQGRQKARKEADAKAAALEALRKTKEPKTDPKP